MAKQLPSGKWYVQGAPHLFQSLLDARRYLKSL